MSTAADPQYTGAPAADFAHLCSHRPATPALEVSERGCPNWPACLPDTLRVFATGRVPHRRYRGTHRAARHG